MCGKRSELVGRWGVPEEGGVAGDDCLFEAVREVQKGDVKTSRGVGGSSERDGGLVGVNLDEADKEVNTSGERTVPNDIVWERLRYVCFESGDGLFCRKLRP